MYLSPKTAFPNARVLRRILAGATFVAFVFMAACSDMPDANRVVATESVSTSMVDAALPPASETATIMMEPAAAPESRGTFRTSAPSPRRGVITAGDVDDLLNLDQFLRYQSKAARYLGLPKLDLARPVRVQLTGPDGAPAPGVAITLRKPKAREPFYQGSSGVDGWVTVFPGLLGAGRPDRVILKALSDGEMSHEETIRTGAPQTISLPFDGGYSPGFVDLVFVIDTTGSMGDELAWLTKDFGSIVTKVRRAAPGASVQYGLVAYRDHGDDYVVRNFGRTGQGAQMQGWLRSLDAAGGGDYPEAAAEALKVAVDQNWRRGKGKRLIFHVADAPPHRQDTRAYLAAARMAASKEVQIFGIGASGVAEESEFLMRQVAAATAGRYLFLTDDSGVGLSHAEPTIACYRVTKLTSLMQRVLISELTGLRVEAKDSEVVRDVGSYRSGVCRQ